MTLIEYNKADDVIIEFDDEQKTKKKNQTQKNQNKETSKITQKLQL